MLPMMMIAQITDLHIRAGAKGRRNAARLADVIDRLLAARPDLVLATGDLTDGGDVASFRELKALLAALPMPVHLIPGNHDRRAGLLEMFPDTPVDAGHVQYVVDAGGRRIILLDTLEEGRHGGHFSAAQADWLGARLAEAPDRPTLIALHHPPVDSGIEWMDVQSRGAWRDRLAAAVAGHGQIVGWISGHIHRPAMAQFAGRPLVIASSTAPQLALDLAPLEQQRVAGRVMVVDEPPGYALHRWTAQGLITHFASAWDAPVVARHKGRKEGEMAG